jgi:hypothetical protein
MLKTVGADNCVKCRVIEREFGCLIHQIDIASWKHIIAVEFTAGIKQGSIGSIEIKRSYIEGEFASRKMGLGYRCNIL